MTFKPKPDWLAKFHEAGDWTSFKGDFAEGTPFSLFESWLVNAELAALGPDLDGVYREYATIYERLLTHYDMPFVWEHLEHLDKSEPRRGLKDSFVAAIGVALSGIDKTLLESARQRANWIGRVQAAAEKLADILDERPAFRDKDKDLPQEYLDEMGYSHGILELTVWYRTPEKDRETRGLASGLRRIGSDLSDLVRGGVIVGHPNKDGAPRVYFVRSLSTFCEQVLGDKASSLVEAVTEVAFDVEDMTDLTRLTRSRKK